MTIDVAVAFDDQYLNQFYALFASLNANKGSDDLQVHCIATGVTDETIFQIKALGEKHGTPVCFYNIDTATVKSFVTCGSWTKAAYYRLYFPFLVPVNVNRLIYIDTDTIVLKSLNELYEQNLEAYPVGAVYDNYVIKQELIGITEVGHYFNSGVLLINIPLWKQLRISEQAFEYLEQYPERIRFVDQCALNAVLKNNWKYLPEKFNCLYSYLPEGMSKKGQHAFIKDKYILHFTLQRPWKLLCKNPYRYLFFYYLKKSGLKKKPVVQDFSYKLLPGYLRNKTIEIYHQYPFIKRVWRYIK